MPTGGAGTAMIEVALRHAVVGVGYGLASACVGGVLVGGVLIGGTFVPLQPWRYRALGAKLDRRTTATTAGLGGLLVLSPVVTYWWFGGL